MRAHQISNLAPNPAFFSSFSFISEIEYITFQKIADIEISETYIHKHTIQYNMNSQILIAFEIKMR
jgi:hypothetical protein